MIICDFTSFSTVFQGYSRKMDQESGAARAGVGWGGGGGETAADIFFYGWLVQTSFELHG